MANKKFKINVFDAVVVAVVIIVLIAAYAFMNRGGDTVVATKKLRYKIEITEKPVGFSELIEVGDRITDNIKNYHMGTVVAIETEPYKDIFEDYENGRYAEGETDELETVVLTLEADVTETESSLIVGGNYVVKAGKEIAVKGEGYAGTGHVISIER